MQQSSLQETNYRSNSDGCTADALAGRIERGRESGGGGNGGERQRDSRPRPQPQFKRTYETRKHKHSEEDFRSILCIDGVTWMRIGEDERSSEHHGKSPQQSPSTAGQSKPVLTLWNFKPFPKFCEGICTCPETEGSAYHSTLETLEITSTPASCQCEDLVGIRELWA